MAEGADILGFHDYEQKRCGRFRAITYDGALTRFSCCKNCKAVVHCKHMHSHSKRCRIGTLNPELLHSSLLEESETGAQGQDLRAKNRLLANQGRNSIALKMTRKWPQKWPRNGILKKDICPH